MRCGAVFCSHLQACDWYSGDVNAVFLKHYSVLRAMHNYYCNFKHGTRQPLMSLKEWDKLMKDADMYDEV